MTAREALAIALARSMRRELTTAIPGGITNENAERIVRRIAKMAQEGVRNLDARATPSEAEHSEATGNADTSLTGG